MAASLCQRRAEYIPGINFHVNPTIIKFYGGGGGLGSSSSVAAVWNDVENEPNNVSIVAIVPGEVCTLSNRC